MEIPFPYVVKSLFIDKNITHVMFIYQTVEFLNSFKNLAATSIFHLSLECPHKQISLYRIHCLKRTFSHNRVNQYFRFWFFDLL